MPKKSRKQRREARVAKHMKEYKKNLYKRETEVLEPGCLALSASAIKHHYYPKTAIKASIKALKNAVKTIKTLKSKRSNKTKVVPKGGKRRRRKKTRKNKSKKKRRRRGKSRK
jgi:hypothetical protein